MTRVEYLWHFSRRRYDYVHVRLGWDVPVAWAFSILKHEEAAMGELLRKLGIGLGKAITLGEYERIKEENEHTSDYSTFMRIMEAVANSRLITCRPSDLSRDCPIMNVQQQFYQEGKPSSGTAPLRMFSFIGSDGETINVMGYDLMEIIKITVIHRNGDVSFEVPDPKDAIQQMLLVIDYHPHRRVENVMARFRIPANWR
jgi:hypothetical protein